MTYQKRERDPQAVEPEERVWRCGYGMVHVSNSMTGPEKGAYWRAIAKLRPLAATA